MRRIVREKEKRRQRGKEKNRSKEGKGERLPGWRATKNT